MSSIIFFLREKSVRKVIFIEKWKKKIKMWGALKESRRESPGVFH